MVLLKAIISIVMKRQAPKMKMLEQRAFSISLLGAGQKLLKFRYNRPEKHFFFFLLPGLLKCNVWQFSQAS